MKKEIQYYVFNRDHWQEVPATRKGNKEKMIADGHRLSEDTYTAHVYPLIKVERKTK